MVLPYTTGVSEDIRRVCGKYGIKVIFKAGRSLCSVLTKVKDPLPMEKEAKYTESPAIVAREHQEACQKGALEKSTVVEHALKHHHATKWGETTVVDMARHPRECCARKPSTSR